MPVYVLGCRACGQEEEVFMGVHDEPTTCPACEGSRRRIPQPGLGRLAGHLRAEAEQFNAEQRAWMEQPEVKEKIMSGEYRRKSG